MFVDEVKITVTGGRGGDGSSSMRREKFVPHGGPAGGNGGRGGDVVLRATRHADTLGYFYRNRKFTGGHGGKGGPNNRFGKYGEATLVETPLGTLVRDAESKQILADLAKDGDAYVLARGGRGGLGSTALTRPHRLARYAERGEAGEERELLLELKLIADVGLVGFPNAGKSTLLSRVSRAKPKIADYPFTTLEPHLGVVTVDRDSHFVMVDIPGLVEGAHEGKGMGDKFLRHIERTRLLVHLVDASAWEGRDPIQDWRTINKELKGWHPLLASKPQIVVANKLDVETSPANVARLKKAARAEIFPISAVTGQGVPELLREIVRMLPLIPPPPDWDSVIMEEREKPEIPLTVERREDGYLLARGTHIERLVARTQLENDHAVHALQQKLYRIGLEELLLKNGAEEGDLVRVGKFEFFYQPGT